MTLASNILSTLRKYGVEEFTEPDTILFHPGDSMLDLLFVLSGRLEMFEARRDHSIRIVQSVAAGDFAGGVDLLSARPSLLGCRAVNGSTLLRVKRRLVPELLHAHGDLAEAIVLECVGRRSAMLQQGRGGVVLVGEGRSNAIMRIRDLLVRTNTPYRFFDTRVHQAAEALVNLLECEEEDLPVVFLPGGRLLKNPTIAVLAAALGLACKPELRYRYDLAIVGAGPAGLAAAVYAASEGLRTVVVDAHTAGGQAGTSSKIENYLGFVTGISGQELAANAEIQAQRFGAELLLMRAACELSLQEGLPGIKTACGSIVEARAMVIATGARYRQLSLPEGGSCPTEITVHYAATALEAIHCNGLEVVVLGGGNSAGQAALFLSGYARRVHLVVRRETLTATMSDYLVRRIASEDRITLHPSTSVAGFAEDRGGTVTLLKHADRKQPTRCHTGQLFSMVGADPNTEWLHGLLRLDPQGFIVTGDDTTGAGSKFETSCQGVFAIGDVRSGSTKRAASAAGEGAAVIADVHRYLASHPTSNPPLKMQSSVPVLSV